MDLRVKTGDKNNAQIMELLFSPSSGNVNQGFPGVLASLTSRIFQPAFGSGREGVWEGRKAVNGIRWGQTILEKSGHGGSHWQVWALLCLWDFSGETELNFFGWKPVFYHSWGSNSMLYPCTKSKTQHPLWAPSSGPISSTITISYFLLFPLQKTPQYLSRDPNPSVRWKICSSTLNTLSLPLPKEIKGFSRVLGSAAYS